MPTRMYQHAEYSLFSAPDLLDYTNECIAELRTELSKLPRVDNRGRSECPFAEKLHAQKEKRQRQLQEVLGRLYGHLAGATAEVRRLERNVTVIKDGKVQLKRQEAQDQYEEAQDDLETRYSQHLQMQNRIWMKIQLVEQVLAQANGQMWPGRRARGQFDLPGQPMPQPDKPPPPMPMPSPPPGKPTVLAPLPPNQTPVLFPAPPGGPAVRVPPPPSTPAMAVRPGPTKPAPPMLKPQELRRELDGLIGADRRRRAVNLPPSGLLPPPLM